MESQHKVHAITMGGGTPGHRWLHVLLEGAQTPHRISASNDIEIEAELTGLARLLGFQRSHLSVEKPVPWPIQGLGLSLQDG